MTTQWKLSGFGDEISADPVLQAAVLRAVGAAHCEVRSAWDTNVVDFTTAQLTELRGVFTEAGIAVSAVASPIGKSSLDQDPSFELDRLERAIAAAEALGTTRIRIFSYYPAEGQAIAEMRDEVITRLTTLAKIAGESGVTLLHENEKDIFGDTPERVREIVESVGSDSLKLVWDPANYVQVGVRHPHDQGFADLAPHIAYVHIKDALFDDGSVTPAGEGDGQVVQTLVALAGLGYAGFVSLEPHLAVAGHSTGFSGPYEFGRAARALRRLADAEGIELV